MKSVQHFGWLGLSFFLLALTACQQNTATNPATGVGRVGVLLTDAPAPTKPFSHLYVTIAGITLLADDEDHAAASDVVLFSGSQKIDLLHLADFSELFSLAGNIPAGEYHKIRLTVDALELVLADGSSVFPKLPSGKIDLNPRGAIVVTANQTLLIQLDVDAEKSIHIVETGNGGYIFRPVIFVDVLSSDFAGKLVRRTGYVHELNRVTGDFALCTAPALSIPPIASLDADDGLPCLAVTSAGASVFAITGTPAKAADLANNQRITVVGFLTSIGRNKDWEGNRVTAAFDESGLPYVEFGAEVIEIGGAMPWVVARGAVGTAPATVTSAFTLNLDSVKSLQAQMQTGTKVFARNGTRLTAADIKVGMEAAVDGMVDATDAALLKSSLVVLNTGTPLAHTSGTIQTINYALHEMMVTTATGDIKVTSNDQTMIFLFSKTGAVTGITQTQFGALLAKQTVSIFGVANTDGVFHASVILAEAL